MRMKASNLRLVETTASSNCTGSVLKMRQFLTLFALVASLAMGSPTASVGRRAGVTGKVVFQFPVNQTLIENVDLLPNGHLIITTVSSSDVFTVDPEAKTPKADKLLTLPGNGVLTGITTLGRDLYAIVSGVIAPAGLPSFIRGSFSVFVISTTSKSVVQTIPVLEGALVNGLTSLPNKPHVILAADSALGGILRIDTRTKEVSTVLTGEALGFGNSTDLPLGVNGLVIRDGHLYFTNSGLGTFFKVRINDDGRPTGQPEVIAVLPGASSTHTFDDFDLDKQGNAYIATHPSSIVKITPTGTLTTVFDEGAAVLDRPASVVFGRGGKALYAVTFGGQVTKITV